MKAALQGRKAVESALSMEDETQRKDMNSTGHCDSKSCDTDCHPVCVPVDDGSGRCDRVCHEQSLAPVPYDAPESTKADVAQKLLAEALGTGLIVSVVVGSGIMAEATSDDVGI